MITKKLGIAIALVCLVASCDDVPKPEKEKQEVAVVDTITLEKKIDETLKLGVAQYEYLAKTVTTGKYPKTYHEKEDKLETSDSGWWCSGFYPGTMLYLNSMFPSEILQQEVDSVLNDLQKEKYNKSTHDLGFMMFCSFGNALKFNPKEEYKEILMTSAESLASRYKNSVRAIRSWDNAPWNFAGDGDFVVIIDNMMNLELLFWATKYSDNRGYMSAAVNHANTTMNNHFRPDYSSYHEVIYNEKTGKAKLKITNQGAADDSSWARGQGWGLYGYTVMYRETQDKKYLEFAQHIADYILNHPNLPKDKIPYWDFNAPGIPDALRDSSAASLMASALLELSTFSEGDKKQFYYSNAKQILQSLLTPEYIAKEGENGGFILKHGVGNMPNGTEIDTPLSYGDYYLVEAMLRYNAMNMKN